MRSRTLTPVLANLAAVKAGSLHPSRLLPLLVSALLLWSAPAFGETRATAKECTPPVAIGSVSLAGRAPLAGFGLDKWDDADRAYSEFTSAYAALRSLDKSELVNLVMAICEAEEADRRAVSSDASNRVRDRVRDSYDRLNSLRDRAVNTLEAVLSDTTFKGRWDRAREYREKTGDYWRTIDRMTSSLRGSNHPVVAYLLERGQEAHLTYQKNQSYCTVYEFTLSNGSRVDCIYADGVTAYVFELKPNNSRARSRGREQVQNYVSALSTSASDLQKLISLDSKFRDVKSFVPKLGLYRLCPEITDDGDFKEVSVYWKSESP